MVRQALHDNGCHPECTEGWFGIASASSWFDKLTMTRATVVTLPADRSEAKVGACFLTFSSLASQAEDKQKK